jgi:hypothetical protein
MIPFQQTARLASALLVSLIPEVENRRDICFRTVPNLANNMTEMSIELNTSLTDAWVSVQTHVV